MWLTGWAVAQAAVRRVYALRGGHGVSGWWRQRRRPHRVERMLYEEVPVRSPVVMIAIGEPEVARALVLGGRYHRRRWGVFGRQWSRSASTRSRRFVTDNAQGLKRPGRDVSTHIASPSVLQGKSRLIPMLLAAVSHVGFCVMAGPSRWRSGRADGCRLTFHSGRFLDAGPAERPACPICNGWNAVAKRRAQKPLRRSRRHLQITFRQTAAAHALPG